MGIDIKEKHVKKGNRTSPESQDVYIRLLVKVCLMHMNYI